MPLEEGIHAARLTLMSKFGLLMEQFADSSGKLQELSDV